MNATADPSAPISPLQAILRKEQEVAERLLLAKAAADARLADAVRAAEALRQAALARGVATAQQRYEADMAAARADAAQITQEAQMTAAEIERQGELHLAEAVQRIIAFILPAQETPS